MKAADITLHRPRTLAEAVELLAALGDDAKILAGGQSLLPIMNMRFAEPSDLIDITAIEELRGYSEERDHISYGAAVTHMMVENQLVPDAAGGLLSTAAAGIGYRAIRNRGTVGGSLAHCDSSAEWPTVMAALGAHVTAQSVRGLRDIAVADLFLGFFTTSLAADEIIVSVRVPRLPADRLWALRKTNRKVGEFAESLAVGTFGLAAHGTATQPNLWLGAARDVPVHLIATERVVAGHRPTDIGIAELRAAITDDIGAADDHDPSARHQLQLHAATVARALRNARKVVTDD
jgi:aerobic carbon-monoxide dehydrogenase medium subunit